MMKKNLLFFTLFAISCIFANNKMLAATSSIKIENQQFYKPELITGVKPLANSNETKLKSKKSIKPRAEAKKSLKKWFKSKFLKTKKTTEGKNNTIYYIGFAFSSSLLWQSRCRSGCSRVSCGPAAFAGRADRRRG